MSDSAPAIPTEDQDQCAGALVSLLCAGIGYADALAVIRLLAADGNTDRTRAIGAMVSTGIPFAEAEGYADDPGMCVALLTHIRRARSGALG